LRPDHGADPFRRGRGETLSRGVARRNSALWFSAHLLTANRSAFTLSLSLFERETMARKKKTDMLQGMLDLLILRTLRQGPLNGWDIMNRIQLVSGEVFRVIPGSLYPALHRLEAGGLVKAEWGASDNNRRAKFYKLTAAGKKQLDAEWETWKRFSGAVELILRDA
jgi:PadR family transcriptional regulator, regulatory protein PadR